MSLFDRKNLNGGIMDVIRCDEESYLLWKWRPEGATDDRRANSLRAGSSIRVKEGEVAIFAYKDHPNKGYDYLVGPYDGWIKTANLPILTSIIGLAYNNESPFQAEVYYLNLAEIIQIRFAVPFFDVYDNQYPEFALPVAVRGTLTFKIEDYKAFIRLHRLIDFNLDTFKSQIKDALTKYIKGIVTNIPEENNISVLQLERKILDVDEILSLKVRNRFAGEFGVYVSSLDIETIEIDKTSEGYNKFIHLTRDLKTQTIEAETQANIRNIHDMQRINVENTSETLRMTREEDQYARHMQTQSANIEARRVEAAEKVGIAGAEGLGHLGDNGGTNVGGSVNPVGLMSGMAIGGAIGQNMAGTINAMMGGTIPGQQPPVTPNGGVSYNVVQNGQATGPFDMNTLAKMIMAGQLLQNTLVWCTGMNAWAKAGDVEALKPMFQGIPVSATPTGMPPIPHE